MKAERRADHTVLLTGAAGRLGRYLTRSLVAEKVTLRLTDHVSMSDSDSLPSTACFVQAELGDLERIAALADGCGTILHFGGVPNERQGFEALLDANVRGTFHVFEAARRAGARVVFASSSHVAGFYERPTDDESKLSATCAYRPDTMYGISKIDGEQLGRLYWDKYGVESVQIRIGSCADTPRDARALSTWLSPADLGSLCLAAIRAPWTAWAVIWGASANPASFWGADDRDVIGWRPQDTAEIWRGNVGNRVSGSPIAERFQGGSFCDLDVAGVKVQG